MEVYQDIYCTIDAARRRELVSPAIVSINCQMKISSV